MSDKITKRQQAVLDVIEQCIREKGYGPTVREVCQALGLSSPSTVHVHLKALEEKGLIKRDPLKSRSIALTYPLDHTEEATSIPQAEYDNLVTIPLVGNVAAVRRYSLNRTSPITLRSPLRLLVMRLRSCCRFAAKA